MRQRRMLCPVLLSVSLLLAPAAWAQQEVIDPQSEPGTDSQPAPPAAPAPSTVPPPARAAIPSPGYQQTHAAGHAGPE